MNRNPSTAWHPLARMSALALLATSSLGAHAQTLVNSATTEDFMRMLGGQTNAQASGSMLARKFSYRPTAAPDAVTGRCTTHTVQAPSANNPRAHRLAVEPAEDAVYVSDTDSLGKVDMQINFKTGTDQFDNSTTSLLNNLAAALNAPGLINSKLAVVGHTDAQGDDTSAGQRKNLELSCARALAVRQYLMQQGVDGTRLGVYGFGSSKPLEQGVVKSAINRRVEIRRAS